MRPSTIFQVCPCFSVLVIPCVKDIIINSLVIFLFVALVIICSLTFEVLCFPTEIPSTVIQYSFSTIRKATKDFSRDHLIGSGSFGTVYVGHISGIELAIKKMFKVLLFCSHTKTVRWPISFVTAWLWYSLVRLFFKQVCY